MTPLVEPLEYPDFARTALLCIPQTTVVRERCIKLVKNPWFDRTTIVVILINCLLMAMYVPCVDDSCVTARCRSLEIADHIIFAYFAFEMVIKWIAMGVFGKKGYLSSHWNKLDCFIVISGIAQYIIEWQVGDSVNLTAIRTLRVLRPLRAVNKFPSMRIVVCLLLQTLPMLGHLATFCSLMFFLFGIIAVRLWNGMLRQRCEILDQQILNATSELALDDYYQDPMGADDFICSKSVGLHTCDNLMPSSQGEMICNESFTEWTKQTVVDLCVNWNQYYNTCVTTDTNPFQGALHFDNILAAWVTIFVAISLEGWTDIMYVVQDAQSFWAFIYFVILIVIGAFFMVQLFLVVITLQYSQVKEQEREMMNMENMDKLMEAEDGAEADEKPDPDSVYVTLLHMFIKYGRKLGRKICKCCVKDRMKTPVINYKYASRDVSDRPCQTDPQPNRLTHVRAKIRKIVLSSWFTITVIIAITLNTVALALEHHNEPEQLTVILEYFNHFFTVFFAVEMVLKLVGLGLYEYVKDLFNVFDAVIVIISLLGMVLFGKKFCPDVYTGESCDCDQLTSNYSMNCVCDRMNFDTFLNASLTVFQVLTTEDWNAVLFNAMEYTPQWSAGFYFVILLTFGNYVVFNLLVAILVDAMATANTGQASDEEQGLILKLRF